MDELLDRFFERLEFSFCHEFSRYIIKVSEVKGSFYVLVKKPKGKILGDNLRNLFNDVEHISEKIYITNALVIPSRFVITIFHTLNLRDATAIISTTFY